MIEERAARLRDEGKYEAAAKLYAELGQMVEAAELYAKVWNWRLAMQTALAGEAYALAYRYSLESPELVAERADIATLLQNHPEEAETAAESAKVKGRLADAARLYETIGNLEEAALLYEKAGELPAAAACHERAGDKRAAGRLYEKHLRTQSDDAHASLKLGQILTSFGRWAHAARALQDACKDPALAPSALALMVACFDALHMQDAARSALERLTALQDDQARAQVGDVAAFLKETFGNEHGLAGLGAGDDAGELVAGRYRIESVLGAGGSGRVLLARDAFYERPVAIKMLNVASGSRGRDSYRRFAREAQVAAGMDHPAVVRVFEFNPDGPFLVMEYMAGGTLEQRLPEPEEQQGPEGQKAQPTLPLDTTFAIAKAMLRGLEAVHRRGVIHRDLKPANVFFSEAGDVKIGDFGVAHLQDQNSTLTGAMMGTLAYMTPEQITGREKPRAGTDLYAFGIILFRMLTGRLPFDGPDFVTEHLESPPKTVSVVRPDLGTRFDALMCVLLAKELDDRAKSVSEVLALLDAIDWTDPEHDAYARMVALERPAAEPSRSTPPSEPAEGERYVLTEARESGAYLAEDTWLKRQVRVEPCATPERTARLRRLATADNPFLQAVFDIDQEAGRAILEIPRGRPFDTTHVRHQRARAQLGEALKSLHATGVVHGTIEPKAIRIGAGRAVLLLPLIEQPDASEALDWAALDRLF